jgi:hypothetical protein
MYIPYLLKPEDSASTEVVCPITGESFVYVEPERFEKLTPEVQNQAVERLPNRFFQRPFIVRNSDGSIRVMMREIRD